MKKNILFTATEIAEITDGKWINLGGITTFNRIVVDKKEFEEGDLLFTINELWNEKYPNINNYTEMTLDDKGINTISAAVVTKYNFTRETQRTLLFVKNTLTALLKLADYVKRNSKAKRVLITGTEGKTGFKLMAKFLIEKQKEVHAFKSSANLDVPILRSVCSIGKDDEFALIEVAISQPNRAVRRSQIVEPHYVVITNISKTHLGYHGSIDNLIKHKSQSVTYLKKGGVCIINVNHQYKTKLINEINILRSDIQILMYGTKETKSYVINQEFDLVRFGWDATISIMDKEYEIFVPMINSYAPLAALGVLFFMANVGLNIDKAIEIMVDFIPGETAGIIKKIKFKESQIIVYDHSIRSSVEGLNSAIQDIKNIQYKGRKISVLANIFDLDEHSIEKVHQDLGATINSAGFDEVYLLGRNFKYTIPLLKGVKVHYFEDNELNLLRNKVLQNIKENDFIFIKAQTKFKFNLIVDDLM